MVPQPGQEDRLRRPPGHRCLIRRHLPLSFAWKGSRPGTFAGRPPCNGPVERTGPAVNCSRRPAGRRCWLHCGPLALQDRGVTTPCPGMCSTGHDRWPSMELAVSSTTCTPRGFAPRDRGAGGHVRTNRAPPPPTATDRTRTPRRAAWRTGLSVVGLMVWPVVAVGDQMSRSRGRIRSGSWRG
jgi:hypothetical protein